ncbi:GNAT family N-acetyltransferase [Flagellimonas sp.]|uniref:GNAT family N-acetyltransferase n=1 Tax=Flagellimonas sp. TaxID=2058762 RepID=UPI003BAD5DC6
MGITKMVNYNFALDLFEKGKVPPTYTSINNERIGESYNNQGFTTTNTLFDDITEVKCIPDFLTPLPHSDLKHLKILKIKRIQGFYIDLSKYSSIADFLNDHFSSKQRARLRSQLRRLENCFDIDYKVYFGQIDKSHYDYLFDTLEIFIEKRFKQRGEAFDPTVNLADVRERCYSMINDKRASLHVLYNGVVPIDICLNYHFQDVLNHSIRSYDIDYAKFGLGNTDIIQQLEWCLENGFQIFDFMWGDPPYKHFWSNKIYLYEHHIFYHSKSIIKQFLVACKAKVYKLKDHLDSRRAKSKNKNIFHGKDHAQKTSTGERVKIEEINCKDATNELNRTGSLNINVDHDKYSWLKPLIYSFQHRHVVHSNNITVHQLNGNPSTYFVLGNKSAVKIIHQNL